jgi:DNA-directed RNA polymerase specialized sigma24 family protein
MTQAEKDVVLSLRQQQYSFSAIAETIGLPLGTIKSFLSRVSGTVM